MIFFIERDKVSQVKLPALNLGSVPGDPASLCGYGPG